jgi:hypothetical protein
MRCSEQLRETGYERQWKTEYENYRKKILTSGAFIAIPIIIIKNIKNINNINKYETIFSNRFFLCLKRNTKQ